MPSNMVEKHQNFQVESKELNKYLTQYKTPQRLEGYINLLKPHEEELYLYFNPSRVKAYFWCHDKYIDQFFFCRETFAFEPKKQIECN